MWRGSQAGSGGYAPEHAKGPQSSGNGTSSALNAASQRKGSPSAGPSTTLAPPQQPLTLGMISWRPHHRAAGAFSRPARHLGWSTATTVAAAVTGLLHPPPHPQAPVVGPTPLNSR